MIRINLLTTERRGGARAPAAAGGAAEVVAQATGGFEGGQKMTVVGSLILILVVLGVGWRYWTLTQQQAELGRQLATARKEEQAIASILKQVQEFEARGEQLKQRLALIDELRKGQNAPVHMVDQISRSLPEMTWLTSLQQQGFDLTIEGRCMTPTSLSDFIGNLEATRYFKKPVEIIEAAVVEGTGGDPDMIRFRIRGTFQMAGVEPPAPPTKPGAKGAPPKGGKRG